MSDDQAGAGEGPDAGIDGKAHDEDPNRIADLAKSGDGGLDPDDGADGGQDDNSAEKNDDDSELVKAQADAAHEREENGRYQ